MNYLIVLLALREFCISMIVCVRTVCTIGTTILSLIFYWTWTVCTICTTLISLMFYLTCSNMKLLVTIIDEQIKSMNSSHSGDMEFNPHDSLVMNHTYAWMEYL